MSGCVLVAAGVGFGLALVAMTRDPPMPVETVAIQKAQPDSTLDPAPMRRQARDVPSQASAPSAPIAQVTPSETRADDSATLALTDPRWARDVVAGAPAATTLQELADRLRGRTGAGEESVPARSGGAAQPDARSAGVEPGADEQTAAIPAPGRPLQTATTTAQPTRNARVTSAVRMRARADNGAAVVTTVAYGATVGVVDCKGWCEIVYDGKRGFIAAKFLETPTASITRAKQKPAARAAVAPATSLPTTPPTTVKPLHR